MNKQEAATEFATARGKAYGTWNEQDCLNAEQCFLAGWDGGHSEGFRRGIEAAAKVAEQFQYVVQHKAGEFGVIRLPAEIRKLAE